jgi:probable rRNA maturation factor
VGSKPLSPVLPALAGPCLSLSVQWADKTHRNQLSRYQLRRWVLACLQAGTSAQITLRFVGEEEGQKLNADYRQKSKPTNVLSFVYEQSPHIWSDLVFCAPVVAHEASAQGISLVSHYAHLVVHGTLHAQGYDHENAQEAEVMEALETQILAKLGFANPYA